MVCGPFGEGARVFARAELATQRLGRLATVDSHGAPHNNPVSFRCNPGPGFPVAPWWSV
jgi:hypothetical protein